MVVHQGIGSIFARGLFRPSRWWQQQALPWMLLTRAFGTRLFVGGLSFQMSEDGLRSAFAKHGEVVDVRIITDPATGKSCRFGFVTFESESDADTALSNLNGYCLDGHMIRVDKASTLGSSKTNSSIFGSSTVDSRSNLSSSQVAMSSMNDATSDGGNIKTEETTGSVASNGTFGDTFSSGTFGAAAAAPVEPIPAWYSDWDVNTNFGAASTTSVEPRSNFSSNHSASGTFGVATVAAVEPGSSFFSNQNAATSGGIRTSDIGNGKRAEMSGSASSSSTTSTTLPLISHTINDSGDFDFRNFPDFDSSSFQDLGPRERRWGPRPKPRGLPTTPSNFNFSFPSVDTKCPYGNDVAETAIPKPRGPEFDFGLSQLASIPPPLEAGAKPQGGFDIDIPESCLQDPPPHPAHKPKPMERAMFHDEESKMPQDRENKDEEDEEFLL